MDFSKYLNACKVKNVSCTIDIFVRRNYDNSLNQCLHIYVPQLNFGILRTLFAYKICCFEKVKLLHVNNNL